MHTPTDTVTDSGFISSGDMGFDNAIRLGAELHSTAAGWCRTLRASRYGRNVTVKTLKEEFAASPLHRSLLRKEFEIGFGLSHPNIAQTISHEQVDGLGDAIISEFVDGPTLKELLAAGELPTRRERLRILSEICDAVGFMHSHGLVHRDLKPSNIMLTRRGLRVKLIDFGAADGDVWSAMKASAGTPRYAAPEQFTAEAVTDPRVDVYAIGRIIGELLPDDSAALAIAGRCTAENPELRPADAASISALISRRRRSRRRLVAAAVASAAIIATAVITLGYIQRPATISPAPPSIIASAGTDTVPAVTQAAQLADTGTDSTAMAASTKAAPQTVAPLQATAESTDGASAAIGSDDRTVAVLTNLEKSPKKDEATDMLSSFVLETLQSRIGVYTEEEIEKFERERQLAPEADSLLALLRDKAHEFSFYHLKRHCDMCDTVSTQHSYVKARSRKWRINAKKETLRRFEPIYKANHQVLPSRNAIEEKAMEYVQEYEVAHTGKILNVEMRAYERVGKPVPLAPHRVPYNWHERVWLTPENTWAVEAYDPETMRVVAEMEEQKRQREILRQL